MTATPHPLDPLSTDEVSTAVAIIAGDDRFEVDAVFVHVRLREPDKALVLAHERGAPVDREVCFCDRPAALPLSAAPGGRGLCHDG